MRAGSGFKPDGIYESGGAVEEESDNDIAGSSDNCFDSFRAFGSLRR